MRAPSVRKVANGGEIGATVSRSALLDRGSDRRFRALVYNLLTISSRMNVMREHLADRMGLSAPQYSVLMAVAQFAGEGGVGVGAVARLLHVSSAFIASETGKLVQAGLLRKRSNPRDRRGVLLSITRAGRALIQVNRDEICAINDAFFGTLDRSAFEGLSRVAATLVKGSQAAMARVRLAEDDAIAALRISTD